MQAEVRDQESLSRLEAALPGIRHRERQEQVRARARRTMHGKAQLR